MVYEKPFVIWDKVFYERILNNSIIFIRKIIVPD